MPNVLFNQHWNWVQANIYSNFIFFKLWQINLSVKKVDSNLFVVSEGFEKQWIKGKRSFFFTWLIGLMCTYLYVFVTGRGLGEAMGVKDGELQWVWHNWESGAKGASVKITGERQLWVTLWWSNRTRTKRERGERHKIVLWDCMCERDRQLCVIKVWVCE